MASKFGCRLRTCASNSVNDVISRPAGSLLSASFSAITFTARKCPVARLVANQTSPNPPLANPPDHIKIWNVGRRVVLSGQGLVFGVIHESSTPISTQSPMHPGRQRSLDGSVGARFKGLLETGSEFAALAIRLPEFL